MYNLGSCSSMLSPALPLPRLTENTWQVVSPPTLRGRDKQTFADFVFGFASMFSRGKSAHMPARRAGKNIGLLSQPSNPPSFYTIFLYSLSPLFIHFPLFFFFLSLLNIGLLSSSSSTFTFLTSPLSPGCLPCTLIFSTAVFLQFIPLSPFLCAVPAFPFLQAWHIITKSEITLGCLPLLSSPSQTARSLAANTCTTNESFKSISTQWVLPVIKSELFFLFHIFSKETDGHTS